MKLVKSVLLAAAFALAVPVGAVAAETQNVRISKGFGIAYLPFMVMEHDHLIKKHAKTIGLGDIKVTWATIDGGNNINDAMLSGALDFASIGIPAFVTLWSKTQGTAQEVEGVAALTTMAMYLNTRNPKLKTVRDLTSKDRIAVPGIKTSAAAMLLQMRAAQVFGPEHYTKLDPLTVAVPHPTAVAALLSGGGEIDTHFASPPFSYMEIADPKIHTIIDSDAILGGPATLIMAYSTTRFHKANPKTYSAFLTALEEAETIINRDKKAAATIYVKMSKTKASVNSTYKIITDPKNVFTTTPQEIMKYVDVMEHVGLIKPKSKPQSWKDLF
ncbi:MAG: ABC transporter substrate-binding protein, partial [Candidatus Micrarchaeaceae archaeon]